MDLDKHIKRHLTNNGYSEEGCQPVRRFKPGRQGEERSLLPLCGYKSTVIRVAEALGFSPRDLESSRLYCCQYKSGELGACQVLGELLIRVVGKFPEMTSEQKQPYISRMRALYIARTGADPQTPESEVIEWMVGVAQGLSGQNPTVCSSGTSTAKASK